MPMWDQSIEILRESIFAYAQICHGNLGVGILAITFLAKLALVPLGLRLAKAAQVQQQAMQKIQPELEAIRTKYKKNSLKVAEETQRVMKREGVSIAPAGMLGSFAQLPILIALYSAVRQAATVGGRFLWISDIAKPDLVLTMAVAGFTLAATTMGATTPSPNQTFMLVLSGLITLVVLSKMAAGIGLYWGLSTLFSAAQSLVVKRSLRVEAA